MHDIALPEKPLQADISCSGFEKKNPRIANTSLRKIFRLVLIEEVPQGLKINYERYRFSGKTPTGRYIVLRTRTKNLRVENTSLRKIFRLIRVEKVTQGIKKIMNENAFPEKPLQADIPC